MSSCSFPAYLSGASVILLLMAGCAAEHFTPSPDYYDYGATINFTFYSNASYEDLDKLSERFIGQDEEEVVTMETTRGPTKSDAVSILLSQEIWTLVLTLMILNLQQLQQTL